MRTLSLISWFGLLAGLVSSNPVAAQDSLWVRYGQSGRLIYQMDHRGDRLLDYSDAGYRHGSAIPDVAASINASRFVYVSPVPGDNRARIQNAIDQVAAMPLGPNGYRGVVQLTVGQYDVSDTIQIGASGVVLRGVGDGADATSNTVLRSTSTNQIDIIRVGNFTQYANDLFRVGSPVDIVDKVVPAGATSLRVADASGYSEGDWINVKRTPTQAWFDHVTSHFADDPSGENFGWNLSEDRFTFQHERRITRIEGDRVFLHAPISHSIDPRSTGTVEHYTDRRVSNVGVQGIRGTSVFNSSETGVYDGRTQFDDEDHAQTFISFAHAEDSWAQNVTGEHLVDSTVDIGIVSRSITVEDAMFVEPVSVVTGGRRYAFNINGSLSLMQDLEADSARRAFINNSTFNGFNRGPNVFLNGVSTNGFVRSGPHANYSTGALYDNLDDDSGFEARRASRDSPHGWRGAHTVIWNSTSPEFQLDSPPGANNYLIGAVGDSSPPDPANPLVDSLGVPIDFADPENPGNSLYVAQRLERQRFAEEESREYWVGDFDELSPGDPADQVYVDPDWLTAIDSLNSSFHSGQPIAGFDDDSFGRRVPFTLEFDLAEDEEVRSAVLSIGMKRRGGASSDDDLLWLDSTSTPLGFASADWGPIFDNNLQVLTLELVGELSHLQDGQLNGVLSNNRAIDWVHLMVNVGPDRGLPGDFNGDGVVDTADYTVWRDTLNSTTDPRADADGDNDVDTDDYLIWRQNFGAVASGATSSQSVPEPAAFGAVLMVALVIIGRQRV
ncbi:MAG: hypothetical protein AAGJ46_09010 [Planctomycetota bacterium]